MDPRVTALRPVEKSRERTAEFTNIAAALVASDRRGEGHLGKNIARALEAAFQRGAAAALEGRRADARDLESMSWLQIPPHPRKIFGLLCNTAFGNSRPHSSLAERAVLIEVEYTEPNSPPGRGWAIYRQSGSELTKYEAIKERKFAGRSGLKLEELGLLKRSKARGGPTTLYLTKYGLDTYLRHLASGGVWYD